MPPANFKFGFPKPELFKDYEPKGEGFHQEVEHTHDLEPMEVSEEEAAKFKIEHGDKLCRSAASSLVNCQLGGTLGDVAFLPTSLRKRIAPSFGLSFTPRLLPWLVLTILMSFTSTYTLRRWEPALTAVWVLSAMFRDRCVTTNTQYEYVQKDINGSSIFLVQMPDFYLVSLA